MLRQLPSGRQHLEAAQRGAEGQEFEPDGVAGELDDGFVSGHGGHAIDSTLPKGTGGGHISSVGS